MNFIILFLYEIALILMTILAIPKVIYSLIFHKKYRHSLLERFGFGFPISGLNRKPSIWIHAVSLGETKAIVSVARELKKHFPDHHLIISSASETGHAEAKRSLPFADYHVFFPLDFSFIVRRIIKKASPRLVVLCESDFWYNFLCYAKKQGAAIALVNGKISERSMRRFSIVSFFSNRLFGLFDVICSQNRLYRGRFIEAGADPQKIAITGNLKFDDEHPQLTPDETADWRRKFGIESSQTVLTIGSTHSPEEYMILEVLEDIWSKHPDLRVILVPRHPERFKEVGQILEKEGIRWINFSDIKQRTGREQVILIDAMGLLRMCYQLSDLTIVGGSFTDKVGGHNILEPCWYGKPVLFGPHMGTQVEMVDLMNQYGGGKQVVQEQLYSTLELWIENREEREEIGAKGFRLVKDLKGSTDKTLKVLEPLLSRLRACSKSSIG